MPHELFISLSPQETKSYLHIFEHFHEFYKIAEFLCALGARRGLVARRGWASVLAVCVGSGWDWRQCSCFTALQCSASQRIAVHRVCAYCRSAGYDVVYDIASGMVCRHGNVHTRHLVISPVGGRRWVCVCVCLFNSRDAGMQIPDCRSGLQIISCLAAG